MSTYDRFYHTKAWVEENMPEKIKDRIDRLTEVGLSQPMTEEDIIEYHVLLKSILIELAGKVK